MLNSNFFKLILRIQKIKFGKNLLLKGVPVIYKKRGSKLVLGNNITINSSFLSNLVGLYSRTVIITRTIDAEITIGDNVGISGATIYARKKITIGDNTLIGGNVKIFDNDFHPLNIEARNIDDKMQIKSKQVQIGKNCFIGANAIILKGTILGDGCIVGAGAVVSGSFADNSKIVGNPAQKI